jgi:hypothetical protein
MPEVMKKAQNLILIKYTFCRQKMLYVIKRESHSVQHKGNRTELMKDTA